MMADLGLPNDVSSASYVGPFSNRRATFVTKFDVTVSGDTVSPSIYDAAFLPDSRLLLLDYNNRKLKLFVNLEFETQKEFGDWPGNVAVNDDSEMAVTLGNKIVRLFVDGEGIKEIKTLTTQIGLCGLAYLNEDTLALSGYDGICYVYTTDGKEVSRLSMGDGHSSGCLAVDRRRSKIYVSASNTNAVYAIDMNTYKILFIYKHESLSCPEAVTVDPDGNFYVCGYVSKNIHQVTGDGTCIQVLLSEKDGLNRPKAMSFAPSGDSFIVNKDAEIVHVYNMV